MFNKVMDMFKYVFLVLAFGCTTVTAQTFCDTTWFTGEGTQYGGVAGSDGGNCGLWVDEGDIYHCALNHAQYDSSMACGACIHAYGPLGDITVKVVDRCPECKPSDIDFSTGAFVKVATLEAGRVPIRWQFVPCPLLQDQNIQIFYDAGTSPYYFKALFSNHYVALQKVEYLNAANEWVEIHREMYNYFVALSGIDSDKATLGPYSFRLTSWTGEQVVAENVEAKADQSFDMGVQFSQGYCDAPSSLSSPTADLQPESVFKVEVLDLQGRLLLVQDQWNPLLLPKLKPQVLLVRQYAPNGVFVQKWIVR